MKYFQQLGIVILLSISTFITAQNDSVKNKNRISSPEFIYIQQAKGAELTVCPNKIGYYLLKITGNDKTLVYFSDKPDRSAGTLALNQFVKKWQASAEMQENSPNAVISYVDFKAENEEGVGADILQLSEPHYDASTDTITFLAKPLHEYELMTGKFENIVIVYDGVQSI